MASQADLEVIDTKEMNFGQTARLSRVGESWHIDIYCRGMAVDSRKFAGQVKAKKVWRALR